MQSEVRWWFYLFVFVLYVFVAADYTNSKPLSAVGRSCNTVSLANLEATFLTLLAVDTKVIGERPGWTVWKTGERYV
jgi:hypothetical protein